MLGPDKTTFHFCLLKTDRKNLQIKADAIGTTPGALVRMLVVDYLKKHKLRDDTPKNPIPQSEISLP